MNLFTMLPCYAPMAFHFPRNSCAPIRPCTDEWPPPIPWSFSDAPLSHGVVPGEALLGRLVRRHEQRPNGEESNGLSEASHSTSARRRRISVRRRRRSIRQIWTTNRRGGTRYAAAGLNLPVAELDSPGGRFVVGGARASERRSGTAIRREIYSD